MSIGSVLYTFLWISVALGLGGFIALFLLGRNLYFSWKKPYKRATESLRRVSVSSIPFLNEFIRSTFFRRWIRSNGMQELDTLSVLFSASDDSTKEYIRLLLPKEEQKKLHMAVKQKRNFTKEEVGKAVSTLHGYLEREYYHSTQKKDLSFYRLFFYEEYAEALSQIQHYKKIVNSSLESAIDEIVTSVLHSIPYYRSRKMFEEQHKYEMFLTKDLPEMLELISHLSQTQRLEKEQELAVFLKEFQEICRQAEITINESVEDALQVKMRAAKEKLYTY